MFRQYYIKENCNMKNIKLNKDAIWMITVLVIQSFVSREHNPSYVLCIKWCEELSLYLPCLSEAGVGTERGEELRVASGRLLATLWLPSWSSSSLTPQPNTKLDREWKWANNTMAWTTSARDQLSFPLVSFCKRLHSDVNICTYRPSMKCTNYDGITWM